MGPFPGPFWPIGGRTKPRNLRTSAWTARRSARIEQQLLQFGTGAYSAAEYAAAGIFDGAADVWAAANTALLLWNTDTGVCATDS